MARTRDSLARGPNNFDNRAFVAAKEIAHAHRKNSKFVLPQAKNVDVKVHGNVARRMKIRRRSIFSAMQRNRHY